MDKLNQAKKHRNGGCIAGNNSGLFSKILEAESIFSAGGNPEAFVCTLKEALVEYPNLRPVVTEFYGWALQDDAFRSGG